MKKRAVGFLSGVGALLGGGVTYAADPWAGVSAVDISVTSYIAFVIVILGAIAGIWIAKKLIKTGNKS